MRRLTSITTATVLGLAALTAGCNSHSSGARLDATRSPTPAVSSATKGVDRSAASVDQSNASKPPRLSPSGAEPHTSTHRASCDSTDVPVEGLLHAIRTGHHATFDRVVFEFCGPRVPEHSLYYHTDQPRHDPSGLPVPLRGGAFVAVIFHGGTTDTAPIAPDPNTAPHYTGPTRLTPNYRLVKEVAIAGDFERVLSFVIGIDHPVGLQVHTLAAPARLVVDFSSAAACRLQWPANTLAKAKELQQAADEGHQPWLLSARSVTTFYAKVVLGWAYPSVYRITRTVYEVSLPTTNKSAIVTLVQPVRHGPGGIWVVADGAK
jgi:hypothetical protein